MIIDGIFFVGHKDMEERLKIMKDKIDKSNNPKDWEDFCCNSYVDSEKWSGLKNDKEFKDCKKYAKELVEETLTETIDCREVTWWNFVHGKLYLTGGMSWGDDPTESMATFNQFADIPTKIKHAADIDIYDNPIDILLKTRPNLPKEVVETLTKLKTTEAI